MCFKYFPPRATASPLHLVVTIAGSTMKNSWWVILSSFTCFWIREYNWICTLHGTHCIPEHYFQMIVILFYLLQTMPGDWVHFAFIFFILICPVGIFNHWTLSMYWMVYLRKLISCLFWQTPEQCDKKQKMRKEGLRIVNGELVMKTCMQRPWMMLVRLEINCNKYPMCDVLWSDLKRTPDVVVQTLSTRCHYNQFD